MPESLRRRKPLLETLRDASRLRCVARARIMRRELSRINDLHRTHRAPPYDERRTTPPDQRKTPKTPGSGGADLSFVRHFCPRPTRNLITMNPLPLCLKKVEISGLVRRLCAGNPNSPLPQPTTQRLTHAQFRASFLPISCVMNRVESITYVARTARPSFSGFASPASTGSAPFPPPTHHPPPLLTAPPKARRMEP
jgi:hypothetical protein